MPDVNYLWYETVSGRDLRQGDLLFGLDIIEPIESINSTEVQIDGSLKKVNAIIMTQSCDLANNKVPSVLLCPIWDLWKFVDKASEQGQNWNEKVRDKLRQGLLPGYHLINTADQDGLKIGLTVVDYHVVYSHPLTLLHEYAETIEKRLRLLPPYREHLSQAFARFFMRVGLPSDITRDAIKRRNVS